MHMSFYSQNAFPRITRKLKAIKQRMFADLRSCVRRQAYLKLQVTSTRIYIVTFAQKRNVFEGSSDYRTFISDLRTFGLQHLLNRKLSISISDLRTFGLQNLRNEEPFISDYRTFGLQNLRTREQSPLWVRFIRDACLHELSIDVRTNNILVNTSLF